MKKILSFLLVFILMVTIFPLNAFAVKGEDLVGSYYFVEGMQKAEEAARNGIELVITKDGVGTIIVGEEITVVFVFNAAAETLSLLDDGKLVGPGSFILENGVLKVEDMVFKKKTVFSLEQAFGIENETKAGDKDFEIPKPAWHAWTDSIGSQWIQVACPVYNDKDHDLYLSSGSVDLEDSEGHLLDTLSMVPAYPEVLKPGEIGWYVESTISDDAAKVANIIPHTSVKDAKVDCIRLEVSDISIKDDMFGLEVTGRVENKTGKDQSTVYVAVILYDKNDAVIGAPMTILTNSISNGDKVGFSASELSNSLYKAADVARYEVYAYPMQFQF